MSTDQELEQTIGAVILDILITLNKHGIKSVSVGAVMRILGVPNSIAERHDDEYVESTDKLLQDNITYDDIKVQVETPPKGTVYH